jgi:hypothetical protein
MRTSELLVFVLGSFEVGVDAVSWPNVKVMAHPLAGSNVDRGVSVEIR